MTLRQSVLFGMLVVMVIAASGCETLKGAGKGAKKDAENFSVNIHQADDWMTEHMW